MKDIYPASPGMRFKTYQENRAATWRGEQSALNVDNNELTVNDSKVLFFWPTKLVLPFFVFQQSF